MARRTDVYDMRRLLEALHGLEQAHAIVSDETRYWSPSVRRRFSELYQAANALLSTTRNGPIDTDEIWATRRMALKLGTDFINSLRDVQTVHQALDRLATRLDELRDVLKEDEDS